MHDALLRGQVGVPMLDSVDGRFNYYLNMDVQRQVLELSHAHMTVDGLAGLWPSKSNPSTTRGLFELGVGVMKSLEIRCGMSLASGTVNGVTDQMRETVHW